MTFDDLNVLVNSWPEGTAGHARERCDLEALDQIGQRIGYGAMVQIVQSLHQIRLHKNTTAAVVLKREWFQGQGWPLPHNFEEVAKGATP